MVISEQVDVVEAKVPLLLDLVFLEKYKLTVGNIQNGLICHDTNLRVSLCHINA